MLNLELKKENEDLAKSLKTEQTRLKNQRQELDQQRRDENLKWDPKHREEYREVSKIKD